MSRNVSTARRQSGAALLAVLWLTAALAAIAFSVASTVRAETERASTSADALRAYYLANGAVHRALLWMDWGESQYRDPNGKPVYYEAPMPRLHFEFPTGAADVEIIPESSKLNINEAAPQDLLRLLMALGSPGDRAGAIAQAIVDWRKPGQEGGFTAFDQYYLSLTPSFRSRHASFEEIEELLLLRGMTPEIFYGGYRNDAEGNLVPYGGLRDCVSVYGTTSEFDVNTAQPAILGMLGMNPQAIAGLVQLRASRPIRSMNDVRIFAQGAPGFGRLAVSGGQVWTLRATARLRLGSGQLSGLRRTVSAMIRIVPSQQSDTPYLFLRWYDDAPPFVEAIPPGEGVTPLALSSGE